MNNKANIETVYNECLEFLYSRLPMYQRIGKAAYKANLDNIISLCNYLGNPQENLKFIHVAGTNGKTSVSHFLSSILTKAGYKTGLYTSPHLIDFRERIMINNKMIPQTYVCEFVDAHKDFILECQPSFFEITVAMAFQYFKEQKVDIAIIEVGLGGRLDSTNIITPLLSIITNIGYDHTEFLGNNLNSIAKEKAGIIKEGVPIIISETQNQLKEIFIEKSLKLHSPLFYADMFIELRSKKSLINKLELTYYSQWTGKFYNVNSNLTGQYEAKNIKAVILAVELLSKIFNISSNAIRSGFNSTVLRGRWEILQHKPLAICDTGHNAEGIKEVFDNLKSIKFNKLHIVFGSVSDKDISQVVELVPKDAVYYFCKPSIPRGMDVGILKAKFEEANIVGDVYNSCYDAYLQALKNAEKDDIVFVGGSTFVVADILCQLNN